MTLMPCRIEGRAAFIARTDRKEAGVGRHPRTILEVVSDVHLRDDLELEDGDVVQIVISSAAECRESGTG